jgi:hypothetical protein
LIERRTGEALAERVTAERRTQKRDEVARVPGKCRELDKSDTDQNLRQPVRAKSANWDSDEVRKPRRFMLRRLISTE